MNRRRLLRSAGVTAAVALVGTTAVTGCCCGNRCDCANMCPYCAECDDGGGDGGVGFE